MTNNFSSSFIPSMHFFYFFGCIIFSTISSYIPFTSKYAFIIIIQILSISVMNFSMLLLCPLSFVSMPISLNKKKLTYSLIDVFILLTQTDQKHSIKLCYQIIRIIRILGVSKQLKYNVTLMYATSKLPKLNKHTPYNIVTFI